MTTIVTAVRVRSASDVPVVVKLTRSLRARIAAQGSDARPDLAKWWALAVVSVRICATEWLMRPARLSQLRNVSANRAATRAAMPGGAANAPELGSEFGELGRSGAPGVETVNDDEPCSVGPASRAGPAHDVSSRTLAAVAKPVRVMPGLFTIHPVVVDDFFAYDLHAVARITKDRILDLWITCNRSAQVRARMPSMAIPSVTSRSEATSTVAITRRSSRVDRLGRRRKTTSCVVVALATSARASA